MGKNLDNRNQFQIYITEEFKPEWKVFLDNLGRDVKLKAEQDPKYRKNLISAGIRKSIRLYNSLMKKKLEETDVKAPVQTASSEEIHLQ